MGAATAMQAGSLALGAGQGIYSMIKANKQKKAAQAAIDNFKAQELTNAYKDLQVSTLGSDLLKEQAEQASASTIDALQKGGSRTLAAGAGGVVSTQTQIAKQAAADLDRQQKEINLQAAAEDQNIQRMKEDRERAELAGLGAQLNNANQLQATGMSNVMDAAMTGAELYKGLELQQEGQSLNERRGFRLFGRKNRYGQPITSQ